MGSERRGEVHRHGAHVATERDAAMIIPARSSSEAVAHQEMPAVSGFSLLRLSLAARLLIVAALWALLWGGVFWALR